MLLKWFAWHINSEFVPFNHLVKSALLEPIEPMILQSSHCEKSEQEAATVFEIRQKTREVNPFIPTLRMVTHWLMVHSDSSSTQATIVSSSLSEEVSNMAMLMPLFNTLIVVMIFRAWVSPWCDDRWVWQEGTRAMFYAFKYCVALSCLYAFNYINCFILVAEGPYFLIIIRLKFRFLLTRLTGF